MLLPRKGRPYGSLPCAYVGARVRDEVQPWHAPGLPHWRCLEARHGEEALRTLSKTQPDLVTLDLVMPGMDGVETLRELKKQAPAVPVIVISGHGPARNIAEWRRLGATHFLRKPFTNEQLELVIRQAVESVLMQKTDFDFELVIGDDCSTDGTREILVVLRDKHPDRIRLILREKNIGGNPNFHDVLRTCHGKYIWPAARFTTSIDGSSVIRNPAWY